MSPLRAAAHAATRRAERGAVTAWAEAARHPAERLVTAAELGEPQIVPWGWGCDHAEGVCLLPPPAGHGPELLVVHHSPDPRRLRKKGRLRVDVLPLRV